jgi:hypothetical protein
LLVASLLGLSELLLLTSEMIGEFSSIELVGEYAVRSSRSLDLPL